MNVTMSLYFWLSYWSTNRLRIFQYFEFKFMFTFENAKQREVIVLNENERDHVIIFLQRNDTILLQIAVAVNKLIKHGISQVAQDYHRNTKKPGNCHLKIVLKFYHVVWHCIQKFVGDVVGAARACD